MLLRHLNSGLADVIGDIILVVVPVKLLWNIRVTRALRIRLITVFSMSIITTIVSLCQNYYLIHDGGVRDFIVSHVEVSSSTFAFDCSSPDVVPVPAFAQSVCSMPLIRTFSRVERVLLVEIQFFRSMMRGVWLPGIC